MPPFELRTSRLLLRPWRFSDVAAVMAYAADPEFSRFLPLPRPYGERDAEQFLADTLLQDWETHPKFAIEHEGVAIGDISLHIDPAASVGTLGYGIARAHWGNGFTTEAARELMRHGFESAGLAKVRATADAENAASWRVMEKLGMQREAYFRSHRVLRGERRDVVEYAILRDEFFDSIDMSSRS